MRLCNLCSAYVKYTGDQNLKIFKGVVRKTSRHNVLVNALVLHYIISCLKNYVLLRKKEFILFISVRLASNVYNNSTTIRQSISNKLELQ